MSLKKTLRINRWNLWMQFKLQRLGLTFTKIPIIIVKHLRKTPFFGKVVKGVSLLLFSSKILAKTSIYFAIFKFFFQNSPNNFVLV